MPGAPLRLHPFHEVNIHENRLAAKVARSLPMLINLMVAVLVGIGIFVDIDVLIYLAAILNVSMWLWITTAAVFAVSGAYMTKGLLEGAIADRVQRSTSACSSATIEGGRIGHTVVFPNYKEDEALMAQTLKALAEADGADRIRVLLAMEAREGATAEERALKLETRFRTHFLNISSTFHPSGLQERHLDGSVNTEVPGKASNLKWAVAKAHELCATEQDGADHFAVDLLTVADADCLFHPSYFKAVEHDYHILREQSNDAEKWAMWQAPQLPFRGFSHLPVVSRVWAYISSVYEYGGVTGLLSGGHHMVFSAYTLPLKLAMDGKLWDGDVIAEDHHAYIKGFFYSIYASAQEGNLQGAAPAPCKPGLRVRPVMYPVKSTSVVSPEGYWRTWVDRWNQALRHSQGVSELSYAVLALWDMLWTLPWSAYNFSFVGRLSRVIIKPIFMHMVPISQAVALTALTCVWLAHNREVPGCPDNLWELSLRGDVVICSLAGAWILKWPVVLPMTVVVYANYLFITTNFTRNPSFRLARHKLEQGVWDSDSGDVAYSWRADFHVLATVASDCILWLAPLMLPYGLVAEVLACWHVMWHGNRFNYVTATKALDTKPQYGATSRAESPIGLESGACSSMDKFCARAAKSEDTADTATTTASADSVETATITA